MVTDTWPAVFNEVLDQLCRLGRSYQSPGSTIPIVEEEPLGALEETPANTWNRNAIKQVNIFSDKFKEALRIPLEKHWGRKKKHPAAPRELWSTTSAYQWINYSSAQKSFPLKMLTEASVSETEAVHYDKFVSYWAVAQAVQPEPSYAYNLQVTKQ